MLVNMKDFSEYIRVEDSENFEGEDSIDLYQIVHNDKSFKDSSA